MAFPGLFLTYSIAILKTFLVLLDIVLNIPFPCLLFDWLPVNEDLIVSSSALKEEGLSKGRAFLYGFISGVVEPIAALLALLLTYFVTTILPVVLAFAAGVMIYVVVEELIPEANEGEHSNLATIGLAVGFVLMMILDIALG